MVAEVPADLAKDGGRGEGGKSLAAFRVISPKRFDERQVGNLHEVFVSLAAASVPHRERARERHEPDEQLLL